MDTRSGATALGCLHVHRTVGGQHDTVVTLGRLAADQLVQDVVTHALGVAGAMRAFSKYSNVLMRNAGRTAIIPETVSKRADPNKFGRRPNSPASSTAVRCKI